MVGGEGSESETDLFHVIVASGLLRLSLCFAEGWQKHRGQNRDDGDHNEQFD